MAFNSREGPENRPRSMTNPLSLVMWHAREDVGVLLPSAVVLVEEGSVVGEHPCQISNLILMILVGATPARHFPLQGERPQLLSSETFLLCILSYIWSDSVSADGLPRGG